VTQGKDAQAQTVFSIGRALVNLALQMRMDPSATERPRVLEPVGLVDEQCLFPPIKLIRGFTSVLP